MRRKSKYKYLIVILLIMFISIGFAYLTSNLDIVGLGHLKRTVWKIYFDNVNILEGGNLTSTPPTTSNHNTTSVTYSVTMDKPGDVYKFNIDIVNNGTVDAMVSIIDENTILTSDQSKYASYSIKYLDGREIEEKNFLGKHSKETLQVIIKYNKNISAEDLIDTDQTLNFKLSLTYTQAKNADSRTGESTIITDLSGNGNDGIMYGGRVNADGTVYLDGVDDFIDCGLQQYNFEDDITYVVRVKFPEVDSQSSRFIIGNWETAGGGLRFTSGQYICVQLFVDNQSDWVYYNSNFKPEANIWYTIVVTYDGIKINFYVDGKKISQRNDTSDYDVELSGNIKQSKASMGLGANLDYAIVTNNGFSKIYFKDALIFDRALTAEEIAADYAAEINPTNTSEMLLRYKFSSNGIVKDLSGNGNNLTLVNTPIQKDGSLYLDGINAKAYTGLENYNFGNSVSIIARAKFITLRDFETYLIDNYQSGGFGLMTLYKKICFEVFISGQSYKKYISNITPDPNKWYTIVGTYDGNKLKLYVNGKEVEDLETRSFEVPATGNIATSPVRFEIGTNAEVDVNETWSCSNITVSDVLIFDRAITKEEVEKDYTKTVSPSNREDLLLYYHFG